MQKVKPLKRFGQNYLYDKNIIRKIIKQIDPQPDETIVEIGPGKGALTEFLYNKTKIYFAIEIDGRVIWDLTERFPEIKIIETDFLDFDLHKIFNECKNKIRLIGNIPYNLTSPIIFKAIRSSEIIKDVVIMVQDEVAKRIIAKKGTKDYGILTVLLNYFSEPAYCFGVSPNAFYPKPNVSSAIVQLIMKNLSISNSDREIFVKAVKACFGNRRKTLKNALSNSIFKELNFSKSSIDLSLRAEQLDIQDFVTLSDFIKKHIDS